MIHLTLQERKVLLLLVFCLVIGALVNIYSKTVLGEKGFIDYGLRCQESDLLDINSAQKQQLMDLPGIGEATAEEILLYRQKHGPFQSVEELKAVKGIGEKKLEGFKGRLVIKK